MKIVSAHEYKTLIQADLLEQFNLYSHPEFLKVIAPKDGFYAAFESSDHKLNAVFPFTGQKIVGKWRLHQVAFCQKFSPIFLGHPHHNPSDTWSAWFQFLKKSWFARWPFEGSTLSEIPVQARIRQNQFFSFQDSEDIIRSRWKKNRIQALKKASHIEVRTLSNQDFREILGKMSKEQAPGIWSPNAKERNTLLRISDSEYFQTKVSRYGLFEKDKCLVLILLLEWNGRLHYLFSQSSIRGYQTEALTGFFSFLISHYAGRPLVFDFEGSNLPGVQAYFKSLGAFSENYFLFEKDWSL